MNIQVSELVSLVFAVTAVSLWLLPMLSMMHVENRYSYWRVDGVRLWFVCKKKTYMSVKLSDEFMCWERHLMMVLN